MKTQILYFALLRDKMQADEDKVNTEVGESIASLADRLLSEKCGKDFVEKTLLFAVNNAYVGPDYQIQEGDTVAFIPPVCGG
jgi:sulfur-carrier protein